jgi:hypothetical protein
MPVMVADEYALIAQRLRELENERRGVVALSEGRWGIWYAPGDRAPCWCVIRNGKWSSWRVEDLDSGVPTLWDTSDEAADVIAAKTEGWWRHTDMLPRRFVES